MLEAKNPMHAQRFGDLISEKATHGGDSDSEASKEADIRAGSGGHSGSKEAQGIPQDETKLFISHPHGWAYQEELEKLEKGNNRRK